MALKHNLVIDQGSDFNTTVNVAQSNGAALDLTGYTARAQFAKAYSASSPRTDFVAEISVENSTVVLSLPKEVSSNVAPGRYVYDCEITDPNDMTTRIVEGMLELTPEVTL